MGTTKREWTDETWNPVTGCTPVSPGCARCYAAAIARRFWGDREFSDVRFHEDRLDEPLHWRKPRMVFVDSMGDLFHDAVTDDQIDRVFASIAQMHRRHTFQVLTKRPERMRDYLMVQQREVDAGRPFWWHDGRTHPKDGTKLGVCGFPSDWPLSNVWLGVTCENQEWADTRIPILLQIPAAVRWVSLEPLLGPVDLTRVNVNHLPGCRGCVANVLDSRDGPLGEPYKHLNWVVCGAETGPGRRWCDTRWVESVVRQCHAAKVPVFVKKLHKPIPGKLPKIVDDINEISNMLGYSPEQLRQWPGKEQP